MSRVASDLEHVAPERQQSAFSGPGGPPVPAHGDDELARFRTFSAWYVAASGTFALIFLAIGVTEDHDPTLLATIGVVVLSSTGIVSRMLATRGRLRLGADVLLAGLVAGSLIITSARLRPLLPAEAVAPVFALSISLAYLGDRDLRRTITTFVVWVAALAGIAVAAPTRESMPFGSVIEPASYVTTMGIVLLSLVQARARLVGSIRNVATAESRSERMIGASLDAIVTADRDGNITAWSPQATRTFGWRADEVLGRQVAETIVPSELREAHKEGWSRYVATGEATVMGRRVELVALHKDGSRVPVELTIVDLGGRGEEGFGAFIHDLTERKAMADERRLLASRLVEAIELERARVSSDIHDGPVQRLTAAILRLGNVAIHAEDPTVREGIERVDTTMQESVKGLRRLMFDLYPHSLRERGIVAALRESLDHLTSDARIATQLHASEDLADLDPAVAAMAYRIAQEVLVNARKHSHARRVDVLVERRGEVLYLKLGDDGDGFDVKTALEDPEHRGLRAIRQRAELASGRLEIDTRPGVGTFVEVWIPLGS